MINRLKLLVVALYFPQKVKKVWKVDLFLLPRLSGLSTDATLACGVI